MNRCLGLAIVIAVLSALALANYPPLHCAQAGTNNADTILNGVFAVTVRDPIGGAFLQDVRVQRLGDRAFVTGKYAKGIYPHDGFGGTYWYPLDDVQCMTEFRTLDEAKIAYEKGKK